MFLEKASMSIAWGGGPAGAAGGGSGRGSGRGSAGRGSVGGEFGPPLRRGGGFDFRGFSGFAAPGTSRGEGVNLSIVPSTKSRFGHIGPVGVERRPGRSGS